jgi:hypothetical protein
MTKRITVVPVAGRSVPDTEAGDLLPKEGREVTDSAWWRRRQADGDVRVQGDSQKTTKAAEATPQEAK